MMSLFDHKKDNRNGTESTGQTAMSAIELYGPLNHFLDIRASRSGDDIILRLRDDCRAFNPFDRIRAMDSEDGVKNIGIRLVYGIAKDVQYQNLLGLNNLVIRI